jgi:hypothetical protein
MPHYVLAVSQQLWWPLRTEEWRQRNEVPADCVTNLRTKNNELSVFEIANDDEEVEVMAALALHRAFSAQDSRQGLDGNDRLRFPPGLLKPLGIPIGTTEGKTENREVNQRHRDLLNLSGTQLANLAFELSKLCASEDALRRYSRNELLLAINMAIGKGRITTPIPVKVQQQLNDALGVSNEVM